MNAVTKSFSLPESLYEAAVQRQKAFGYEKFSDYIQALITQDLRYRGKVHYNVIMEDAERQAQLRLDECENLRAELQWQTDRDKRQALRKRLEFIEAGLSPDSSIYPPNASDPSILNEESSPPPQKKRPGKSGKY